MICVFLFCSFHLTSSTFVTILGISPAMVVFTHVMNGVLVGCFRCLEALRHPFLCGPRWRVDPSMDFIRWSLGSTAVRIIEEYIYGQQQVNIT